MTLAKAVSLLSFTKTGFISSLFLALSVGAVIGYFLHMQSYGSVHLSDASLHTRTPNIPNEDHQVMLDNNHISQINSTISTADACSSIYLRYPELSVLPLEFSSSLLAELSPNGETPSQEVAAGNSLLASGTAFEQNNNPLTAELTLRESPFSTLSFSATLRGITGIGLYNNRSGNGVTQQLNNFAVSVLYRIAEEQHIGIEGGQETLPSIVINPDGSEREKSTIEWMGVAYRYAPYSLRPNSSVRPFGQVGLGGSTFGPTLKTIVGFEWQPSSSVGLMFGTEGSVFAYKYSSTWYYAQKLGLTGGLVMKF